MSYLVACVISMVCFQQLFRLAQHRRSDVLLIAAANYVVAAAVSAARVLAVGDVTDGWGWLVIVLGGINGLLYFLHLLVFLAAFRIAGVGVTSAIFGTSLIVPVITAYALWSDPIGPTQWAALALVPIGMFMMRPRGPNGIRLTWKADLVLFLVLAVGGVIQTIHKAIDVYAPAARPNYVAALFMAAALSSVGYALIKGIRFRGVDAAHGAVIGAINLSTTAFLLMALSVMPAAVFFPVSTSLMIGVNVVLSWILWRERITPRQAIGLVVAAAIVLLASTGSNAIEVADRGRDIPAAQQLLNEASVGR